MKIMPGLKIIRHLFFINIYQKNLDIQRYLGR